MRKSFSFILSVILTSILMLPCGASVSAAWPFWFDSQPQFPSGYGYSQQHQQQFAPNGVYYAMSVTLHKNHFYAPYGRANTKFYEQYGLTTIRMEGQWRAY